MLIKAENHVTFNNFCTGDYSMNYTIKILSIAIISSRFLTHGPGEALAKMPAAVPLTPSPDFFEPYLKVTPGRMALSFVEIELEHLERLGGC